MPVYEVPAVVPSTVVPPVVPSTVLPATYYDDYFGLAAAPYRYPYYGAPAAAAVPRVLAGSAEYLAAASYRYPYYGATTAAAAAVIPRVYAGSAEYLAATTAAAAVYPRVKYGAYPYYPAYGASRLLGNRSLDYLGAYPLDYPAYADYPFGYNPYVAGAYPYNGLYDYAPYVASLKTVQKSEEKKSSD